MGFTGILLPDSGESMRVHASDRLDWLRCPTALFRALFACGIAVLAAQSTHAQTTSEIEELKALLQQTQDSMERMMQEHQEQIEGLNQRIQELESRSQKQQVDQQVVKNELLEQEVKIGELDSAPADRLSIHGYFDVQYLDAEDSNVGSFVQNELSVFLRHSTPDERWTIFSEIEFEVLYSDDYFFVESDVEAELEIETAWLEYVFSDELKIRAGKHLLPHYWQTYHYPNLTMSTRPPAMVGRVFPKDTIGVEARGDWWWNDLRGISYVAYVGNGGDSEDSAVDRNENKAVGGHVTLHLAGNSHFETLDLGASAHIGDEHSGADTSVYGLDAQVRVWQLEFLSELAWGRQEASTRTGSGLPPNVESDGLGYYAQIAYNFKPRWHTFYRFDELDLVDDGPGLFDAHQHTVGLNFRPIPSVSLKLEGFRAYPDGDVDPFNGFATSVVYNF